ncbi:hypothetical protein FIBSPDRAFT_894793 [Athelia psychrophila]|uniref:Uncharacterized protein n=1 Tax=Athelia psychrophila TaxID=1759441 RepID=A0A166FCV4_9AGAM|nr:hypothetical protein FIBSPDRAFT_894793 [Fibularhizoctonia sp. CBS 109695]
MAWIRIRTHLLRVRLEDNMTEHISIKFADIPLCFDLMIPPTFEEEDFNRPPTGDEKWGTTNIRRRVGPLHPELSMPVSRHTATTYEMYFILVAMARFAQIP